MKRALLALVLLAATVIAPFSSGDGLRTTSLRLGGNVLQLVSGQGSLWVLTCDRGCSGQGKRSVGRIVRIDPRSGRVVGSAVLARPGAIAVGARGVDATDFWHDTVRRLDPRTLRVTRVLKLELPFFITTSRTRDNAFLPIQIAVGSAAVWIATDRGALARADLDLRHVVAIVRLPFDAFGGIATDARDVWVGESLLGLYRVSGQTNRVVARIQVGPTSGRLVPTRLFAAVGELLAVGEWADGNTLTNRNGFARIDRRHNRVEAITALPPGPLATTYGNGSLWLGRLGSTVLERIDPDSGRVLRRYPAHIGIALAFAGGHVWTASRQG